MPPAASPTPYYRHRQPWRVGLLTLLLHGVVVVLVLRALPAPRPPQADVIAVRVIRAPESVAPPARPVPPPRPVPPARPAPIPPVIATPVMAHQAREAARSAPAVSRPQPAPVAPESAKPEPAKPLTPAVEAPSVKEAPAEPAPLAVPPRFDAAYLNNPAPTYPAVSRRNGENGTVLLRVAVSAEGAATAVSVAKSSGADRLDEAARRAVQNWRFVPARRGSEAVAGTVLVPITFALSGATEE